MIMACILAGCGRGRAEHDPVSSGVKRATLKGKPPAHFELKVETIEGGASLFVFRFPDRVGLIPKITSISIGKVGMGEAFCILLAKNLDGELIAASWQVGMVPDNYRIIKGCHEKTLSPGDYEVQIFTLRGGENLRLHVNSAGNVQVLPWEESTLPWR